MIAEPHVFAQEAYDKVVMLNGEEHTGKVTEMNAADIKFIYKGETLNYTFNKSEIHKIQFASGRIQIINKVQESNAAPDKGLQSHHNVIAVLPFAVIKSGGPSDNNMENKIQSDCYNVLLEMAKDYTVQDPVKTNAVLIKHNITRETIAGYTPEELTHILEVEYVVMGTVDVMKKGSRTTFINNAQNKREKNKKISFSTSSAYSSEQFQTQVDMKIYSDNGQNIYAKSHIAFWQVENAYVSTLRYLLKRSPFYHK